MLDVNLPKTALPGERIQFTVRATNLLEPATSGSISVSFPDNVAVTIADSSPAASGGSFAQVFRSGATIFSFSMNRAIPAQYPLAELYLFEAWQLEEERHLTLMVRTPEDRDSLTIQVRMTLRNAAGLFNFPANGPTDQQGFTIQKYLLPVAR